MTRDEFLQIDTWDELFSFAVNNELYDEIGGYYSSEELEDRINNELATYIQNHGWRDVRDVLSDIPDIDEDTYYRENDYFEFYEADDDDFDYIKNEILESFDEWDEPEEEFYIDEEALLDDADLDFDFDEPPVEEEPFTLNELFSSCNSGLKQMTIAKIEEEKASDDAFADFIKIK